jgi:hypothetical protein
MLSCMGAAPVLNGKPVIITNITFDVISIVISIVIIMIVIIIMTTIIAYVVIIIAGKLEGVAWGWGIEDCHDGQSCRGYSRALSALTRWGTCASRTLRPSR